MSETATLTRLPGALRTAAMAWAAVAGFGMRSSGEGFGDSGCCCETRGGNRQGTRRERYSSAAGARGRLMAQSRRMATFSPIRR